MCNSYGVTDSLLLFSAGAPFDKLRATSPRRVFDLGYGMERLRRSLMRIVQDFTNTSRDSTLAQHQNLRFGLVGVVAYFRTARHRLSLARWQWYRLMAEAKYRGA